MDPNATLAEMREISARIMDGVAEWGDADRLSELVAALDGWLSKGGFLPAEWAR